MMRAPEQPGPAAVHRAEITGGGTVQEEEALARSVDEAAAKAVAAADDRRVIHAELAKGVHRARWQ